jgi:CDGSH-type Zn-finger protein
MIREDVIPDRNDRKRAAGRSIGGLSFGKPYCVGCHTHVLIKGWNWAERDSEHCRAPARPRIQNG